MILALFINSTPCNILLLSLLSQLLLKLLLLILQFILQFFAHFIVFVDQLLHVSHFLQHYIVKSSPLQHTLLIELLQI